MFKIFVDDHSPVNPTLQVDQDTWLAKFKALVESDGAGGLGKAYCVVEETGGDKKGKE
jgi:hypothetical protein